MMNSYLAGILHCHDGMSKFVCLPLEAKDSRRELEKNVSVLDVASTVKHSASVGTHDDAVDSAQMTSNRFCNLSTSPVRSIYR
jgi:hypothetical protein